MVLGPASESIASLAAQGKRFDLAFLDADKTGYLGYYNQVSSQCSLPTSVLTACPPVHCHRMHSAVTRSFVTISSLAQLMDMELILPGGAIIVDNTLMKVIFFSPHCSY